MLKATGETGLRTRLAVIRDCLWYGLRPSSWYEPEPHYDCGYWRHLAINLLLAVRMLGPLPKGEINDGNRADHR